MSDSGHELRENNEKIVQLMALLKQQRDEMDYLIAKQQEEKTKIQNEIEKLSFKLQLLTKSLHQRLQAKVNYDKTIGDIENNYSHLVQDSGKLLFFLTKEVEQLEEIMDKKTNTAGSIVSENEKVSLVQKTSTSVTPEEIDSDSILSPLPEEAPIPELDMQPEQSPTRRRSSGTQSELERRNSSNPKVPYDPIDLSIATEQMSYKTTSDKNMDYANPPPIKFKANKKKESDDPELQSYREAYGKQHNAQSPPVSMMEVSGTISGSSQKRSSVTRRTSRRRSATEQ